MKVIKYYRTAAGGPTAIHQQREAIEAFCAATGLWGFELEDVDKNGDIINPALLAALEALSRREAEGILVQNLARLSRNQRVFNSILDRSRREGWKIIAVGSTIGKNRHRHSSISNAKGNRSISCGICHLDVSR
jgi:DNA invertase Pin-like site-specific DNA recombinase